MPLEDAEIRMWEKPPTELRKKASDAEIDARYDRGDRKIVVESNREKLPNFVEALKRPNYMLLRPFYQRRLRWDQKRQSRFIESFILNIPVPPLFLYETSYNSYEVIDGQQRITAVRAFYDNDLILKGLEYWPELNGRKYSTLPGNIRSGIDRRSISYNVVLTESAHTTEDALLLKQLVFERLNSGGVKLSNQEIRNNLYNGEFNKLLFRLAKNSVFRQAWGIPQATRNEDDRPSVELLNNKTYSEMSDVEIVLRFFALRNHDKYQRGMQGFLDLYMIRSSIFDGQTLERLEGVFNKTIQLAGEVFGERLFRPYDKRRNAWSSRPQKAFADAVLVGFSESLPKAKRLIDKKDKVIEATKKLFEQHPSGTFTGRGNTKHDVTERIMLFQRMLAAI